MATNTTILGDQESKILDQLGELIPTIYQKSAKELTDCALLESFDIWEINPEQLEEAVNSKTFLAHQTPYQHHQIQIGGQVVAYAVSQKLSEKEQTVVQFAPSDIAKQIDEAITRLDNEISDETPATLLIVSSFRVYTFWLVNLNQVYIISAPDYFESLKPGEYLGTEKFLSDLNIEINSFMTK